MSTVLLVDDEVPVVEPSSEQGGYMWYYAQALRDKGFDILQARGPDEALRVLSERAKEIDLVVMDVMMPSETVLANDATRQGLWTGIVLVDRVVQEYPSLPILILTNLIDGETRDRLAKSIGQGRVFFKPYTTPFEFAQEVQDLLER